MIVAFHDEPLPCEIETIRRHAFVRLTRRWEIAVRDGDTHLRIEVPRGYMCDGASVPLIAQPVFALTGGSRMSLIRPGVMHDYLYSTHRYPRRKADRYFREYARQEGLGVIAAWGAWIAVRLLGWAQWRDCAERLNKGHKGVLGNGE